MAYDYLFEDIVATTNVASTLYKRCYNSSNEFSIVTDEIRREHTALVQLQNLYQNPDTSFFFSSADRQQELHRLVDEGRTLLRDLDSLYQTYLGLGVLSQGTWDRSFGNGRVAYIKRGLITHLRQLEAVTHSLGGDQSNSQWDEVGAS